MPTRPMKACAYGCPEGSHPGPCPRRPKDYDKRRGSAAKRGYDNTRWRAIRAVVLAREPLCRECYAHGRVTAATDVDHIQEKAKGGADTLNNLRPLCHSCHSRRTWHDSVARRAS